MPQVNKLVTSHIQHQVDAEQDYLDVCTLMVAKKLGWKMVEGEDALCMGFGGDSYLVVPFSTIDETCSTYQDVERCLRTGENMFKQSLNAEEEEK